MSQGSKSQFLYYDLTILLPLLRFFKRPNSRLHRASWLPLGQVPMMALKFGISRFLGLLLSLAQPTTSGSLATPRWVVLASGKFLQEISRIKLRW